MGFSGGSDAGLLTSRGWWGVSAAPNNHACTQQTGTAMVTGVNAITAAVIFSVVFAAIVIFVASVIVDAAVMVGQSQLQLLSGLLIILLLLLLMLLSSALFFLHFPLPFCPPFSLPSFSPSTPKPCTVQ